MNCCIKINLVSDMVKIQLEHYEATKCIYNELHNNQKCLKVFLDLTQAFNTVYHDKLFDIWHFTRQRWKLDWTSYSKNRIQMVSINSINNILSNKKILSHWLFL